MAIEYALIASLIAAVLILSISTAGHSMGRMFDAISAAVVGAAGAGAPQNSAGV